MFYETKFEERINKTIALIQASPGYQKWLKKQAAKRDLEYRRRILPKGWHRCGRKKQKRPCWTPRDPATGLFIKGPPVSKTPLCDAILARHRAQYQLPPKIEMARPAIIKIKKPPAICLCGDIVQHFLSCNAVLFRKKPLLQAAA